MGNQENAALGALEFRAAYLNILIFKNKSITYKVYYIHFRVFK